MTKTFEMRKLDVQSKIAQILWRLRMQIVKKCVWTNSVPQLKNKIRQNNKGE